MAVQRIVADVGGGALEPLHMDWSLAHVEVVVVVVLLPLHIQVGAVTALSAGCVRQLQHLWQWTAYSHR